MKIIVQNVFVETHYLIRQIERYHRFLYRIYSIIAIKTLGINLEAVFQIVFKAINNLVRPNSLVPTLFIFDIHCCIIETDTPSLIITQQATTMQKVIDKVKQFTKFC